MNNIIISRKTAEFLMILIGQNSWGNQKRRAEAAWELAQALGTEKMTTSSDCFDPNFEK